ncbi:unnamed protein product, partial [Pocillopora meandrina]
ELRRLRRDLKHSQRSVYSCGTYSNLRTLFKAFFLFCFYFKLTPVPAELTTVCLYVQFLSRTLTPPSIRNYLSGVKLLHLFSAADYPFTKGFVLSLTLRGIARRAFHTPRRAPPVSPSLLLRLSSFLLLNAIQFGERLLHIPLLSIPGSPLCPVSAYRRMIELIPAHRSCPVFLLPGPSGVVPFTKRSFVSQFRTCLSHIGVPHADRYRGHSFRRGAASWAFSCGVPGELIQLYGDWSSDSYKLYFRV